MSDGEQVSGRYELLELVGRGGVADVWRAHDRVLGRDVALKRVRERGLARDEEARAVAEARTLAQLNHPGLVAVYDAGVDDGRPYLVMELIDGVTLSSCCNGTPMQPEIVAAIGAQVADALDHIHALALVHRDIKPANILVSGVPGPEPRARLADFGIATLVDQTRVTATGMTVGTAAYLSPEQVRGHAVSPATDVYALGLVLLECLTGEREFPGAPVEAALARLHRQPNIPEGLPHP